ncbi:hypothetical protein DICVIV_12583 [Dictyocaulus viviparus]|uniref:Uncharacterized protein n=1 Tax=Dictyocaulus viviparus TaxID=29172 RepID=A0A0D8XCR8_DICVI|nr:hypothetical protein DICVIV_12583 [Dictyocaulus viviparus]
MLQKTVLLLLIVVCFISIVLSEECEYPFLGKEDCNAHCESKNFTGGHPYNDCCGCYAIL